ncbi:MAG: helix-turn-helix transcriptional regulator [Pseudomonadota bacterium]|nr:helix-turn-helix transcriptional regulator [Pseudomonadota bacterium]
MEKHPDLVALGKSIRRLRTAANRTQEELASIAELSTNYVGEMERGERNPSFLALVAIARALKVSPAELFA